MLGHDQVSILMAFTAGLISFFSPCILPLIPSYLSFISGISFEEMSQAENLKRVRWSIVTGSLFFILGFSVVFLLLGIGVTLFGQFLDENIRWFEIIGGGIVIILGLNFIGVLNLKFLHREKRFKKKEKPLGPLGIFLTGMAFGSGWTPCVGPMLVAILAMAASTRDVSQGIVLLIFYSAGLGIPFLVFSVLLHSLFEKFQNLGKYLNLIRILGGFLLIIIGALLMTGRFLPLIKHVGM